VIALLRRRKTTQAPGTEPAVAAGCTLNKCGAGARATILGMACSGPDACRLRALGICEGTSVTVVRTSDCTLLDVRGSRVAVGASLASGIMVLPVG
jgi:Fe2+ transport system protein FeoA